mgnify:FL=1|tara:strand:+ start:2519 stop:2830 length:312 start_codon:yes stop_codon:yes gene_type:complete
MPTIPLIYDHYLTPDQVPEVAEEALHRILVGEFGAKNLTVEKTIGGDVIFDFDFGGTFISGKIKVYDSHFDMILKVPLLVSLYRSKITEELNKHIPKYFGEQK